MNESNFVNSFFFRFDPFVAFFSLLSEFLYCKPFQNNKMHCVSPFETNRCIVKSLIATSTFFFLKPTEKRKLEKWFLGARVWTPKPAYRFPKRPEYVIVYLPFCYAMR